ncbi:MAG: MATE family efflux transporter [Anaerolineales bacterium]|nr:MATE family efflux transporter [Anaerolineales bacterium]
MNRILAGAQRAVDYYRDPEYFRQLLKIGVPIALQQLIFSGLGMVGYVMIGQRGDVAMAAVGLANQVFFLFNLVLFGFVSGAAMVTAQLWGKRDVAGIRRVLALTLWLSLAISTFFVTLSELIPVKILGLYSSDPQVIALGSDYLRIFAGSFVFFSISFTYGMVLRSIGNVRLPMVISVTSLGLNILLSYGLIFGRLGLPELGVVGAAWAAFVSRILECFALLTMTYATRSPAAARLRDLLHFDRDFFGRIMKPVLPVALNELFWSLGITTYNAIYGHIGTEALAAINIAVTVDNLALVLFMGISSATSVLVGNKIGAGKPDEAYQFAGRSLGLGAVLAVLVGTVVLLTRAPVVALYNASPAAAESAYRLLTIIGSLLWMRMTNMVIIIGILRGGGDTRFSLFLDGLIIWILGVPMALLGAFVLDLPVHGVYLMVMSEEFAKWLLGLRRYFSRRWIHDLTHLSTTVETNP